MTTTDLDLDAALNDVLDHEYDSAPAAAPAETEPYIAALPVSALFADPTYQRDLDTFRVDKMADVYRVALVGIIEVSERADGRYAILDGQHRAAVVKSVAFGTPNPDPHIPCRIHTGLSVTQEAETYGQLNTTRRQLTGWDRWVARRGAQERAVLDIEQCAHRHGLVVGMQAGGNVLRATKACENVVAIGGVPLLDEVLSTVRQTWPDDQAGMDAAILLGLGLVLSSYDRDELDLARLVNTLAGVLPRQLTARASAAREIHKGALSRLAAHVIVEQYNSIKAGRVTPFLDRVKPQTKTITDKTRRKAEKRDAILFWAATSGDWVKPPKQLSRALVEAYDAAHSLGGA